MRQTHVITEEGDKNIPVTNSGTQSSKSLANPQTVTLALSSVGQEKSAPNSDIGLITSYSNGVCRPCVHAHLS